jgi:hypothetical protein
MEFMAVHVPYVVGGIYMQPVFSHSEYQRNKQEQESRGVKLCPRLPFQRINITGGVVRVK